MDNHSTKIYRWLYPVSWIYGTVIAIRNKLFDWKMLRSKSFQLPVICIGNLAVGGTGKTPHTEYLIKLLCTKYHIAVLSRGYKRHTKGYVQATSESNAESIGDEPYQIFSKFPEITVAVDEERCHGIERILEQKAPPIDVVLLDDAFQHRYVKPGLSILLTDFHRLFCDDALLPAGRLRESIGGKNRAQVIIVTKCPQEIKPIDFNIISKRLNLFPYQQLFFSSFRYGSLKPLFATAKEDKAKRLSSLKETDVLLITGIASPDALLKELKRHTTRNVETLSFGDHHHFTCRDMEFLKEAFDKLKGEQRIIVTTEKDATRLIHHKALDEALKPFIYALPIEITFLQNQQDNFNQYIFGYVRENKRNRSLSEG